MLSRTLITGPVGVHWGLSMVYTFFVGAKDDMGFQQALLVLDGPRLGSPSNSFWGVFIGSPKLRPYTTYRSIVRILSLSLYIYIYKLYIYIHDYLCPGYNYPEPPCIG